MERITVTTDTVSEIKGLVHGGAVALAEWDDDTAEGPIFVTRIFTQPDALRASWSRGPYITGIGAVVRWMRGLGATSFTVSCCAAWDGTVAEKARKA